MFEKATGKNPWDLADKDVDEFKAGIDPIASAGKLGALLAQFPSSFRNDDESRAYLEWLLKHFRDYQVARRTPPSQLERSARRHAAAARRVRSGVDPDRRTEVPVLHPPGSAPERSHVLLPAPPRPQRRAVVEPRTIRGPLQLPVFGRGAPADRPGRTPGIARGQEGVSVREQSFLGQVGRQCRDPQTRSRPVAAGRVPAGVRRSLSGPERPCQDFAAASFTKALLRMSATWILSTTSMPLMTCPKTVYLPSKSGCGFVRM